MTARTDVQEKNFPIAIIGSGFGGLGMAIRLQEAGLHDFTILERADEIGGTWRDNTYPGVACDVPSHVYSFSFEPNPEWNRIFAPGDEIQRYLLGCVERYGLRSKIRFNHNVTAARFDERSATWTLTTEHGAEIRARAVVSAVGGLVDPAPCAIPGASDFAGEIFHTARWDHSCNLAGKRVAVIGTGASAIQVVPAIATEVQSLTVFQRTAAWVVPRRDRAITATEKHKFRTRPDRLRRHRSLLFWFSEMMGPLIILDWPWLSRIVERASLRHLEASVADPSLREKLTPHFQFGCKRMLISDDYWASFERPNVELVTEPIECITRAGIRTADGREHPFDVIVLATGYKLGLASAPFEIVGRAGRTLGQVWGAGAEAFKGMCVPGFPNWFIIMGPNTGPGHTSVLVYTEAQIGFIRQALLMLAKNGTRFLDVRRDVTERWNAKIERRMKYTSWSSGCASWYLSPDGKNHSLFPGFATEYTASVRRFRPTEFEQG